MTFPRLFTSLSPVLLALGLAFSPQAARGDCSLTTTGLIPLPDLGTRTYQGFTGGLYPGGTNVRPPAHAAAGLAAAAQVQPLDRAGNPDAANGRIVLISVGMSSVTQEWNADGPTAFLPRANLDSSKAAEVTVVDGAEGGKDAPAWANPNDEVYTNFLQRLADANVTKAQVQVAWFEEAIAYPAAIGGFPEHAQDLQTYLGEILRNLKALCPNLRIVYMTSRDRAYVDVPNVLNPEPFAYETSFAVRWTIADQIDGTGNLNFDPAKGPVVSPYITWGPYVWADGTNPRSDGFTWLCSDFEQADYTHPSADGSKKVADQLLAFFKTDPTASSWFLKQEQNTPPALSATVAPASGVPGSSFQFSTTASSGANPIIAYQWTFDDGTFANVQNPQKYFLAAGSYQAHVTVTDSKGNHATATVSVSVSGTPVPTPTPSPGATPPVDSSLVNVSTRGEVGNGDQVLIGGFIVSGSGDTVMLRAIGPSLTDAGLSGALADPTLELHDSTGALIGQNNNWQVSQLGGVITTDQSAAISTSGIAPTNTKESAILATLPAGAYTVVVHGLNGSSGIGLTEVYDLGGSSSAQLVNISTRGSVQTADQVLIGGFIIGAGDSSEVLVRGLGPSLAVAGVTNFLADPVLELRDSNGTLIRANDDWTGSQKAAIQATGAAPTNAKESAILQLLPPGSYTATVSGKNGTTGIGLVEVYHLN